MAFGIKSLKKEDKDQILLKKKYIDHLIVGDDFVSCLLFCKLIKEHGSEKVYWLRTSSESAAKITERFEQFSFLSVDKNEASTEACFYKDQEFRVFGSRVKSQELTEVEKILTGAKASVNFHELIKTYNIEESWNGFDQNTKIAATEAVVVGFSKSSQEDLIEIDKWSISTSDHMNYICDHLYWCDSVKKLKITMNKNELSVEQRDQIEILAGSESDVSAFVVHYKTPKWDIPELPASRVFIPTSLSKEMGYFVGEIHETHSSFFHEINSEEEMSKEEIARRLKKLKNSLERIFKTKVFDEASESIYFSTTLFYLFHTELQEIAENHLKNIYFLGANTDCKNILLDKINGLNHL